MKVDYINNQMSELFKSRAKSLGLTQVEIARDLKVSLPTVKRWYSGKGFTIAGVHQFAEYLGLSLSELFSEIEKGKAIFEYTNKQEMVLSKKPELLAFFDHLLRGRTIKQIVSRYKIVESRLSKILLELDRMGLIELHENNKVKLLKRGEPVWKKDGPLAKKFREVITQSFLDKVGDKGSSFYIHDYLEEDLSKINLKVDELKSFLSYANKRAIKSEKNKKSFGIYFGMAEFSWDMDSYL